MAMGERLLMSTGLIEQRSLAAGPLPLVCASAGTWNMTKARLYVFVWLTSRPGPRDLRFSGLLANRSRGLRSYLNTRLREPR
jgi:hypothetical protein